MLGPVSDAVPRNGRAYRIRAVKDSVTGGGYLSLEGLPDTVIYHSGWFRLERLPLQLTVGSLAARALAIRRSRRGTGGRQRGDEAEALRSENEAQRAAATGMSVRIVSLARERDKFSDALTASEKLVAFVSERYGSAVRKRKLRSLGRRLKLALRKLPVRRKAYELVSDSAFFERHFYLNDNDAVRAAGLNPVVHYLKWGSREGRSPNPFSSESDYRNRNPVKDSKSANLRRALPLRLAVCRALSAFASRNGALRRRRATVPARRVLRCCFGERRRVCGLGRLSIGGGAC
jgi:hypothetical protein